MKKSHIITFIILGVLFIYFPFIYTADKQYLFCQTTSDHEKIIQGKKLENNIPTKFVLFYDRPYQILIYPYIKNIVNEKKRMDFRVFEENLKKEKYLFRLELGVTEDDYEITRGDNKKFPYAFLTLYRSTMDINYIDKERYSGRFFVVIANCKTWKMISGEGGRNQI